MDLLLFCFLVIGIPILIWVIDIYLNRHPLNREEFLMLARKRQRKKALQKFNFSKTPQIAAPMEKKSMNKQGEFIESDLNFFNAPARIAGLLKYKKHEWIVIAFICSLNVFRLWWNKGPDGTRVWLSLELSSLKDIIRTFKVDSIAIFHNHPNPNPSYYSVSDPSEADLRSADFFRKELSLENVNLLEFICERGIPSLYYANFFKSFIPMKPIMNEIQQVNGKSILSNYRLRKELCRKTNDDQIFGKE